MCIEIMEYGRTNSADVRGLYFYDGHTFGVLVCQEIVYDARAIATDTTDYSVTTIKIVQEPTCIFMSDRPYSNTSSWKTTCP